MLHRWIIRLLILVWIITAIYLLFTGYAYYRLPLAERPHSVWHDTLKPSGTWGHAYGILGSLCLLSLFLYSFRKRVSWMKGKGSIRKWLDYHIFLGLMGPLLITFHSSFKFGGLVSVAYWSMMAVMFSGFIGRYLYAQIPRTIAGEEMTLKELKEAEAEYARQLRTEFDLSEVASQTLDHLIKLHEQDNPQAMAGLFGIIKNDFLRGVELFKLHRILRREQLPPQTIRQILNIASREALLRRKIHFLETAQKLFHFWHVVHKPFAYTMITIMFIHIIVAILFGYTWHF
ncbi:MAG: hypothetical protein D6675_04415 [Gemmatimonadetes bacterium]|nr:MAG: hypothetical protein D6675_04415 [Gemmatimonadota bacterium]